MTEENKRDLWGRDDLIEVTPWADFIVSEKNKIHMTLYWWWYLNDILSHVFPQRIEY